MSVSDRFAGFECSPIATWVSSLEPLRIIWANAPALALWEAESLADLRARDNSNTSETSRRQARVWMDAFRAKSLDVVETEWTVYPHGQPKRLRIYISPIELDDGELALLQQAFPLLPGSIDPEILRGAEAIRHTSVAVATLSSSGEVLSRNPAMTEAFGLATPPASWFEDPRIVADILAVARHGQVHRAEVHAQVAGQLRNYALEARKTQDPVSGEDAILLHLLDETARLGAERDAERKGQLVAELTDALARLDAQQQRWRALVESAPDHVLVVDREHRIEFANRALPSAEHDAGALVGRRFEQLFAPDEHPRISDALARALAQRSPQSFEASIDTPGEPRRHHVRIGPIGASEQLIVISHDVTEHRALEQQLQQSQKMQAIGALAGGIAHDFNNLLTIIIGACELIELTPEGDTLSLVAEIRSASERAATLTRQLLTFSRKQLVQPKPLELGAVVRDMTELLARVLGEDVTLHIELDERPCWLVADRGQLEQVLMNLAVNARDAMPAGGSLTLATRWHEHDERVVLEVRDTGPGISPELQARVFEPFFTTKPLGKGTGLGLSIVHGIVEQNRGRIELTSTVGRGARFCLSFPRSSPPAFTPAPAPTPTPQPKRERELILLLEDQLAVRNMIAQQLERHGYRLLLAGTADEAIAHARAQAHIDVLLSDIVLPDKSGPWVRDAIVAVQPEIKVLFMTGYTDDAVLHRGVHEGREHLLQKPFTGEQLLAKLRELLDGS